MDWISLHSVPLSTKFDRCCTKSLNKMRFLQILIYNFSKNPNAYKRVVCFCLQDQRHNVCECLIVCFFASSLIIRLSHAISWHFSQYSLFILLVNETVSLIPSILANWSLRLMNHPMCRLFAYGINEW